jgi:hypothetical protein
VLTQNDMTIAVLEKKSVEYLVAICCPVCESDHDGCSSSSSSSNCKNIHIIIIFRIMSPPAPRTNPFGLKSSVRWESSCVENHNNSPKDLLA